MRRLVAIAITLAAAAPAAADDREAGEARPYTTPFTATGELLRAGEFQRSWNVGMQWDLAVGLSDRVELRVQAELLIVADLQLRVQVLPADSPVQLVLGGSAAGTILDSARAWLGGSATAAYATGGFAVHATTRSSRRVGHGSDLGLTTAGITARWGDGNLVFLDAGQIAWPTAVDCPSDDTAARTVAPTMPAPTACTAIDHIEGVAFGVWSSLRDRSMSIGVSAIIARRGDTVVPILPLLMMSWTD